MTEVDKNSILEALRSVEDPDLRRDIVSLDFVKSVKLCGGVAAVTIELTTPACPVKDQLKEQARQAILALPGIEEARVEMTARVRPSTSGSPSVLSEVKNTVLVGSGKGGVGKSTVSANLAVALARSGAEVGLMDADVYGPTIPTLFGVSEKPESGSKNRIRPVNCDGLKLISMGFFLPKEKAVIWRGPMLDKMMTQFLTGVEWGELDYLIIDLPPGTGDIQLSLCQKVPLTGAVVVSTPQDVALNVAKKSISMFNQLNTPILGLVENMSYYVCNHCGKREDIFGSGGARLTSEKMNIPFLGEIPLSKNIREYSDQGKLIVQVEPDSEQAKAFVHVAEHMAAQISMRNMAGASEENIKISF